MSFRPLVPFLALSAENNSEILQEFPEQQYQHAALASVQMKLLVQQQLGIYRAWARFLKPGSFIVLARPEYVRT